MAIKVKKALIIRGATYKGPIKRWVVKVVTIDKSKIFMSSKHSEFELELYTNAKAELFIEGEYSGRWASISLKLRRTSTTVEDNVIPAEAAEVHK